MGRDVDELLLRWRALKLGLTDAPEDAARDRLIGAHIDELQALHDESARLEAHAAEVVGKSQRLLDLMIETAVTHPGASASPADGATPASADDDTDATEEAAR